MAKQIIPFDFFVSSAGAEHTEFINQINEYMKENNSRTEIKEAASGYVVSYIYEPSSKTVANYVFRKKGPMIRIYADHVPQYMDILGKWPKSMKDSIKKAGSCKRLLDPEACNPRCPMGFDFILDGERQQKCRNNSSMFFLSTETKPYLKEMIEHELKARKSV